MGWWSQLLPLWKSKDIEVRAYVKRDGTRVSEHTRRGATRKVDRSGVVDTEANRAIMDWLDELSRAIKAAGYDGIVTVHDGGTSEIVDLTGPILERPAPPADHPDDPWHTVAQVRVLDDVFQRFKAEITHHAADNYDTAEDLVAAMQDLPQRMDLVAEWLEDEAALDVRPDGRFESDWKAPHFPEIARIIGSHPVVMHHHTSSALLPKILEEGLKASSKGVDNRSTARHHAVYLTVETSGAAVAGYQLRAVQTHGGDPITLEVETYVDELRPDPDDSDISAGMRQSVTDHVPPGRILNLAELNKAMSPDRVKINARMIGAATPLNLGDAADEDELLTRPSLWLDTWGRQLVASAAGLPQDAAQSFIADPDAFIEDPTRAALVEYELDGAWASLVEQWM